MPWYKKLIAKITIIFAVIGPAIIAGTANNDAGGISTYSFAGSKFGYHLLGLMAINFFALATTQQIGIRLGIYTGKGLASLIRENFGVRWTFLAIISLFIANLAVTTSEFAGLAASLELFNLSKYLTIPILAFVIWIILYKGSFKKVERFFLFISLFFFVYIISAVMSKPDWGEAVGQSIHFSLLSDPLYLFVLLGVMGTTITPWGQFFIQSYVVDKGIHPRYYKIGKFETIFSAFFTCFIAAMIIITTKNVLFDHGIVVDSAGKAALALQPILGVLAKNIFAIGFFFASLLGAFILPLTTSYSICEAFGLEHGMNTNWRQAPLFYSFMAAIIILPALCVIFLAVPLFKIMLFAQVVNGILLPIILAFIITLLNRGERLGLPKSSLWGKIWYNFIVWVMIIILSSVSLLLVTCTVFPSLLNKIIVW